MKEKIKSYVKWAWSVTAGFRWQTVLYMLMEIVSMVLLLCFVYCSKEVIDIASKVVPGNLQLMLVFLVLSVVISAITGLMASWIGEYVKNGLTKHLQSTLAHSQMIKNWEEKRRWRTGDLLVRLNTDCADVVQMLVYTFPTFIVTGVKLLAALAFMWAMDPLLAQLILAITPLFLFSKLYYRKMRKINQELKQAESQFGNMLQENLNYRTLIQALLLIDARDNKLMDTQESIFRIRTRQLKFASISRGILKLAFNGGYLLAFLWGIYRLNAGEISYGTIAAFLQLVSRIQMPVVSMIAFLPAAIRCRVSIERLIELDAGDEEDYKKQIKLNLPLTLKLDRVSFKYDTMDVIKQLTAEFQSGIPAAITGISGTGKTTLIRLILALIKPDSGRLTLIQSDGISHEISVATRGNFSYDPQVSTLFYGTIRENLLLANSEASEERIDEVLKTTCAEFVYSFPEGLDTVVGESGYGLSQGQAERIAMARALLRGGNIWLFDEPTSALDTDTAKQLIQNLMTAGKDKLLIFVTHDHQLIKACPQVVRLD